MGSFFILSCGMIIETIQNNYDVGSG